LQWPAAENVRQGMAALHFTKHDGLQLAELFLFDVLNDLIQ
jgi:hypothetical protein